MASEALEAFERQLAAMTLPDGFRLWTADDANTPPKTPELGCAAYHGPLGEYLHLIHDETEGHPAAVGFYVLAYVGVGIGTDVRFRAGREVHHPNLWGALVGPSAMGRKGVAMREGGRFLEYALPEGWAQKYRMTGFGSGEAFVYAFRDPDPDEEPDVRIQKRKVIEDQELGLLFAVAQRPDSTFSGQLRKAFDGDPMENRTRKGGTVVATGHHVGVVGAITPTELRALLDEVSVFNGFGNRFLYLWAQSPGPLPFGGDVDDNRARSAAQKAFGAFHRSMDAEYRLRPDTPTGELWRSFYAENCYGVAGAGELVQTLTARNVAHAARIATVYAAMDGARELSEHHLRAAIGWVDYSTATVRRVFGTDGVAGLAARVLDAVRDAMPEGLTSSELDQITGHRATSEARQQLEELRLIHVHSEPTGRAGRPTIRLRALHPDE